MKVYRWCGVVFVCLLCLTGCGKKEVSGGEETAESSVTDWKANGFAISEEVQEEQTLWAGQYLPWEHKSQSDGAVELSYLSSGVCGELFWYFGTELDSDGIIASGPEGKYVLEIYDTDSGECTVKRFSPGELGLEGGLGYLVGMDMLDGEHYMLRWAEYEQDEEGMYFQTADRMVYTDFAGNIQSTDFWEIYLKKGIDQEVFTVLPMWPSIACRCDGNGNIYVINQKENGNYMICLFDRNGEVLLEHEGKLEQQLLEPLCTRDGELIIPVYDSVGKYYEFLWADTAKGELRSLTRIETPDPYIVQMYGMLGDDVFYRSREGAGNGIGEGIVKWNIKSGRKVWVFNFQTVGIDTGFRTMLALREGQTPFLRLTKYKEGKPVEWLTALTEQRTSDDGIVRVVDLTSGSESSKRVAECAVLTSLENPNFRYEYEDASAQEARDRILAELSQGKGPDLMFVSQEDLYMLEEKGLLLDIGELIPQELQEKLLPGALEIGTVDGRLLGVPAAVKAKTLVVSEGVWSEDTWRLEDVIRLMEEGKLSGAVRSPYVMGGDYLSPFLTVHLLVGDSLGDSFLIDWENRTCHFDDERFIRLLELTGTDMSSVPHATEDWLNGENNIAWCYFTHDAEFLDFFVHMEQEDGRIVGYPTEGACGSYLMAEGGVLVVNADIAQKEAAAYFLDTLLGEELQSKKNMLCLSVRKLDPEDYIVKEESGRLVFLGGEDATEVPVFQDGSTSLHRAKDFLESCVAVPPGYSQISQIISEELNAMYAENKSSKTTAGNINNRVQLYLDEGN